MKKMIECKNKQCSRKFSLHRTVLYDIIEIEKFSMELREKVRSFNIEIQCPYCQHIFAIPIEKYFKIKNKDDLERIEEIRKKGVVPF